MNLRNSDLDPESPYRLLTFQCNATNDGVTIQYTYIKIHRCCPISIRISLFQGLALGILRLINTDDDNCDLIHKNVIYC